MPQNDMPQNKLPHLLWHDLIAAFALLTRLPVPGHGPARANGAWAWPVAGAAVALVATAGAGIALWLGLSTGLAAGIAIALQVILTGALHEDGLADSADGLWGGRDRARRLEIMKDSRIGSYGVLALLLVNGLRWQALDAILMAGALLGPLLTAALMSRAVMAGVMALLPNARGSGLSNSVGRPDGFVAGVACVLALVPGIALVGWGLALICVLAAVLGASAVAALARARIGGQTGDILGFVQQVSELAVLVALTAMA